MTTPSRSIEGLQIVGPAHPQQSEVLPPEAQEFLAALPGDLPECLILDLQMPEMNGLELLQQLTHREIQIPTIIITAHGDIGVREHCESAGAVAFLLKPVQDTSLFAAIDDVSRIKAEPTVIGRI